MPGYHAEALDIDAPPELGGRGLKLVGNGIGESMKMMRPPNSGGED